MGKSKYLVIALTLIMVLTGCSISRTSEPVPTVNPTGTALPTQTPTSTPEPTETSTPYWPDGVTAVDVTNSTSKSCSQDLCVFVKLTAHKNCSSITLDGTIYTESDEESDWFEDDYKALKKGKTRVVEFGTDVANDYEEYVELDSATCWK